MRKFMLLFIIPLLFGVASCEQPEVVQPEPSLEISKKDVNALGIVHSVKIKASHLGVGQEYFIKFIVLLKSEESEYEYFYSNTIKVDWAYEVEIEIDPQKEIKWLKLEEGVIELIEDSPPDGWE